MTDDYIEAVERDGYAIVHGRPDDAEVGAVLEELKCVGGDGAVSRMAGSAFGVRNLLNVLPSARPLRYWRRCWR